MGGRRYSEEQKEWLRANYNVGDTYADVVRMFNERFNETCTVSQLHDVVSKRMHLHRGTPKWTLYGVKKKEQLPIGTIRKSQTMTYIKVKMLPDDTAHKSITGYQSPYWEPLQKKIYEDAHGKLKEGEYVCFLDHNPENFSLENLYPVTRQISAYMSCNRLWSDEPELTKTAILLAKLRLKLSERT